ncbi:MAG: hypothetical protein K0Q63_3648, partial [Paenibacillus sp.]|nr:hypothetical protein [Paenibacillus sp.]
MKETWQRNKKAVTVLTASLAAAMLFPAAVFSANKPVEVFLNGQTLSFGEAKPIMMDGRTLVPFRAMFEALGYSVTWDEDAHTAIGERDGFMIRLPVNSHLATVGGEETALDVPALILEGNIYVPLRFVSEHSGYEVIYMSTANALKIGVSDGSSDVPIPLQPEPRSIIGRVTDEQGEAERGIPIKANSLNTQGAEETSLSDEYGYYAIELPDADGQWQLGNTYELDYGGAVYSGKLLTDAAEPVSSDEGGVSDLVAVAITGSLRLQMADAGVAAQDVVLTFSPIAPLPDGTEGETVVKRAAMLDDGMGLNQLPIGQYEITAHYMPIGGNPVPMSVR